MSINLPEVTTVTTNVITSKSTETTLTIGYSEKIINSLNDVNIHLGNIEALGKLFLQLAILYITFKGLYFIVDNVFFSGV